MNNVESHIKTKHTLLSVMCKNTSGKISEQTLLSVSVGQLVTDRDDEED